MSSIQHQLRDDVLVLAPQSRIDGSNAGAFESEALRLIGKRGGRVVLDATQLAYISSAGLRALLTMGKQLRTAGGALLLCGLQGSVREVFEISGFSSIFATYGSVDEALAAR